MTTKVSNFSYLFLRRPYSSLRSSRDIGFRCMKLQKPPRVHSLQAWGGGHTRGLKLTEEKNLALSKHMPRSMPAHQEEHMIFSRTPPPHTHTPKSVLSLAEQTSPGPMEKPQEVHKKSSGGLLPPCRDGLSMRRVGRKCDDSQLCFSQGHQGLLVISCKRRISFLLFTQGPSHTHKDYRK